MFLKKGLLIVVVFLVLFMMTACGSAKGSRLDTPVGTFEIEGVQLTDRFPPDCDSSAVGCSFAESGYQILIIWLDPPTNFDGSISEAMAEEAPYLVLDGGNRVEIAISGIVQTRYFIAFTPPVSAAGLTLNWPDNPPVDLGQFLGD